MQYRQENDTILLLDDSDNCILSMRESQPDDETVLLELNGTIPNTTTCYFENELVAALTVARQILVDMHGVSYICYAAMRSLLDMQILSDNTVQASLILYGLCPKVYESFESIGLSDSLDIRE